MPKHFEGLGDKWRALVGNPDQTVKELVPTIAQQGGTREVWQSNTPEGHTLLLAWPADEPCRAALILRGDQEKNNYAPVSALPLLEGLENELEVHDMRAWANDAEGEMAITNAGSNPFWFYNPVFYRDRWSCNSGQKQIFKLAALAYALRPATRDSIQVKGGPQYDAYAAAFLEKNPKMTAEQVPPLTLPLKGSRLIQEYAHASEYQLRVPVEEVSTCTFNGTTLHMLTVSFGGKGDKAIRVMLYVSPEVLGDYTPKTGDDIEAIAWLQGRLTD